MWAVGSSCLALLARSGAFITHKMLALPAENLPAENLRALPGESVLLHARHCPRTRFILAETLVQNGTAVGMAPPASTHANLNATTQNDPFLA